MCNAFKEWIKKEYGWNTLADITNHGCISGFSGLTYYSETTALYRKYKDDIWEMLNEDTESFGYKNVSELISTFNGADCADNNDRFENLLVWYAVEKVAFEVTDGEYRDDE
jgi:hypothetical protein